MGTLLGLCTGVTRTYTHTHELNHACLKMLWDTTQAMHIHMLVMVLTEISSKTVT